jgi:glycosyltransferase involved in cell wall biosynthesis
MNTPHNQEAGESGLGTSETITSVMIAAETIGERGGLGNYLVSLRSALEEDLGGTRRLQMTEMASAAPVRDGAIDRLRAAIGNGTLKRLLRPIYRGIIKVDSFPQAEAWAAAWRKLDASTVCLLPHVVCKDEGALDEYYEALSARRLVWVVHDLHPLHFPEQWNRNSVNTFHRRCKYLAERARAIICHNNYTKEDLCERLGVAPDKVAVARLPSILPPCSPDSLPSAQETLRTLGIQQPYALWASSSTFGHKNHERLLKAWRMLHDSGLKIGLVCTGSKEPRWPIIEALIADLGLREQVVFTGSQPREILWVILQNAKLAVCPTLFEGGGSGPAVEAVVAKIPLACARIPQVLEQFDSRVDFCDWFDPSNEDAIADCVRTLMANYDAAIDRATRAARIFPDIRSWAEVAGTYWGALENAAR